MNPTDRKAFARAKILQRANLSEDQLASAMINNTITELIDKKQADSLLLKTDPPKSLLNTIPSQETPINSTEYLSTKKKFKRFEKIKALGLIFMGLFSSCFVFNDNFSNKSNFFALFLLLDFGFNIFFRPLKINVDKEIYSPALSGFISVVQKLVSLSGVGFWIY